KVAHRAAVGFPGCVRIDRLGTLDGGAGAGQNRPGHELETFQVAGISQLEERQPALARLERGSRPSMAADSGRSPVHLSARTRRDIIARRSYSRNMCGIAAIFGYGTGAPPVDPEELTRIRDAMSARGPDGEGLWISDDRRVGLGNRRLAIIDLSAAAAQPMATEDGKCLIVFNGEIYNYRELRSELAKEGFRFRSTSDTEVLLCLYRKHGPGMVDRL